MLTFDDESFNVIDIKLEFLHEGVEGHFRLVFCHLDEGQQPHFADIGIVVQA